MTPTERQVERIATIWPTPRMSRFQRAEYTQALEPYHPDAVAAAVNAVRDTWLKDIVPPPGEFTSKAQIEHRSIEVRELIGTIQGDGAGCPDCRHEYPDDRHAKWRGNGTIIACLEHGWTWRGTTHDPDATDPGELAPGEWRQRALTGEFGAVCQAIAAAGHGPTAVTTAIAGDLAADLRNATIPIPEGTTT